jgi:hypothetical protein
VERDEAVVGEHTCHCGLTGLTRDELDQHMQKAHGAPPFTSECPFDDKPMPGLPSPAAIEELGLAGQCRAATLDAFVTAARALKAAEEAYRAAQQTYAEAVKRLSEEAVR